MKIISDNKIISNNVVVKREILASDVKSTACYLGFQMIQLICAKDETFEENYTTCKKALEMVLGFEVSDKFLQEYAEVSIYQSPG